MSESYLNQNAGFQSHARGSNTFMNESCYTYEVHSALMQSCHTYTWHFALIHAYINMLDSNHKLAPRTHSCHTYMWYSYTSHVTHMIRSKCWIQIRHSRHELTHVLLLAICVRHPSSHDLCVTCRQVCKLFWQTLFQHLNVFCLMFEDMHTNQYKFLFWPTPTPPPPPKKTNRQDSTASGKCYVCRGADKSG